MPLIQVRDVPEEVRDELARKAALAGKSLQSYLLGELTRLSEQPSMAEIVARAQARAKAAGSTVTMADAVAAVRAGRDRDQGQDQGRQEGQDRRDQDPRDENRSRA